MLTLALLLMSGSFTAYGSGNLSVSFGDDGVIALRADKQVTLKASVRMNRGSEGCGSPEDFDLNNKLTVKIELPTGVELVNGTSAEQELTVTSEVISGKHEALVASWPVRVAEVGKYRGVVSVVGTSKNGLTCSDSDNFRLYAISGNPKFSVKDALFQRGSRGSYSVITVPVKVTLPGMTKSPFEEYDDDLAVFDVMQETHLPEVNSNGKSMLELFTKINFGKLTFDVAGAGGGAGNYECVDFASESKTDKKISVRNRPNYKLRFNWNKHKGFSSVTKTGKLKLHSRATTKALKACSNRPG